MVRGWMGVWIESSWLDGCIINILIGGGGLVGCRGSGCWVFWGGWVRGWLVGMGCCLFLGCCEGVCCVWEWGYCGVWRDGMGGRGGDGVGGGRRRGVVVWWGGVVEWV